jgi:hypothetical protein
MSTEQDELRSVEERADSIVDTRFQSYLRFYIHDILNSEQVRVKNDLDQNYKTNKFDVIKIREVFVNKVALCGYIVKIYDAEKFFRLTLDDSTGSMPVTLWKSIVFQEKSLALNTNDRDDVRQNEYQKLYKTIQLAQNLLMDESVNNCIMYEPNQGDLVLVKGVVQIFKGKISLNARSCVRLKSPIDEIAQIMLPAVLATKVYSARPLISVDEYETAREAANITKAHDSIDVIQKSQQEVKEKEQLLNMVYRKLIEFSQRKNDSSSCEALAFFNSFKTTTEFRFVSYKQVLNSLKELELRGLAYSCEDDLHYLPIV